MKATWKRLDNGVWGICVESALGSIFDVIVGQEIDVERSDGNVSKQRVTKVVKRIDPRPAKRVRGRTIPEVTSFLAFCEVEPREKASMQKRATSAKRNGTSWGQRASRKRDNQWGRIQEGFLRSGVNRLDVGAYAAARAGLPKEIRTSPEEMAAAERCLRPRYAYNVDGCGPDACELQRVSEGDEPKFEDINFAAF